jgi:hypothetical protein
MITKGIRERKENRKREEKEEEKEKVYNKENKKYYGDYNTINQNYF